MTITGAARLAGVMGWPVSHSRSPVLHNFWLREYGIDGVYMPLAVAPEAFEQALGALALLGFAGVNVTVPHKEAAFAAVDETDRLAERIGAVNTIVFDNDGRACGTNTDAFGFVEGLRNRVPGWSGTAGPRWRRAALAPRTPSQTDLDVVHAIEILIARLRLEANGGGG